MPHPFMSAGLSPIFLWVEAGPRVPPSFFGWVGAFSSCVFPPVVYGCPRPSIDLDVNLML